MSTGPTQDLKCEEAERTKKRLYTKGIVSRERTENTVVSEV